MQRQRVRRDRTSEPCRTGHWRRCCAGRRRANRMRQPVDERIGKCIRLALGRIARIADRHSIAHVRGVLARLHRMRDLVRDQALPIPALRVVAAVAKENVIADREGVRTERTSGGVGIASRVDAHIVEARTEYRFEKQSQAIVERCTVTPRAHDQLRRVGVDLAALGAAHHRCRQLARQGRSARSCCFGMSVPWRTNLLTDGHAACNVRTIAPRCMNQAGDVVTCVDQGQLCERP